MPTTASRHDAEPLLLAVDYGTQSVRAIAFDLQGQTQAVSRIPVVPYTSPQPGWAEQEAGYFWSQLCTACRGLWQSNPAVRDRIAGVAITTQRSTLVNLDSAGEPLRPAIVWPDQRRTGGLAGVGGAAGMLFALTGTASTVRYFQSEAETNWLWSHTPDVWQRTHKFLLLSGYLTYRLTGRLVDSSAAQVGYLPFDYRHHTWAASGNWKWRALPGIRPDQLPDLVPPGAELGTISQVAADQSGIPAGLPLIAAGTDKACESLGAGCITPDIGCLSYGTAATINITTRRYVEPQRFIPPYPGAMPNTYSPEIQIFRGFWLVNWFKEEFGHLEQQIAARRGILPEDLFDDLVNQVPAGSMGLMSQPYWTPGLRLPGPEARGGIIGFGDVHTRAHMYRSLLEGLAFALRDGLDQICLRSGQKVNRLRVSGGGSQSDAAMQLTADIFGLPAARPAQHEASALGAAITLAVGLNSYKDFTAAVAAMTSEGRVFEPDASRHRLYDALYHRVYRLMYRRLKPLYKALRDITGYPPALD